METTKRSKKRPCPPSPSTEIDLVKQQKQLKKRIQNRNSQKCYREKQLSYVRTLENIVNSVVPAGSIGEGTVVAPRETELRLIRKNQDLQDALLRLRKKFLSLSTAATSGAEDQIFQDILNISSSTPEQIAHSPETSESKDGNKECPPEDAPAPSRLDSATDIISTADYITGCSNILPYGYLDNTTSDTNDLFSHSSPFQTPDIPSMFPITLPTSMATPQRRLVRLSDQYASFNILGVEESIKSIMTQTSDPTEIENAIGLAVRIMLKHSPLLEDYFNFMGGVTAIEKIINWRLHPSPANRDKIPPPFKPTTLQQHFPHHHYCIDFLLWGELRDQLLLHMGDIDFPQLGMDCVMNLVQDVPGLNLSLPSLEACHHLVGLLQSEEAEGGLETLLGLEEIGVRGSGEGVRGSKMVFETLKRYRLDNLPERKLSPRFAEKYPFLDLSNITTTLPVASFCGSARDRGQWTRRENVVNFSDLK